MAKPQKSIDGKVLQYSDLNREQQRAAEGAAFGSTSNMKTRAEEYISSGRGKPKDREAISAALPYLKDKKVSIASAARNRKSMIEQAATDPSVSHAHENLPGAGWYFEHHRDLANSAKDHGFETSRAVTASAVMSPQNSPENEKAAVSALMAAHSAGKVRITDHVADWMERSGHDMSAHRGQTVHARDLTPESLAALSSSEIRDHVEADGFDVKDISRGGTKENIAKAVRVLRGEVSEKDAIDPHSSPKVHSYRDNIRDSVPDTNVHSEYMMRAADLGSKIRGENNVGQQMFDYFGLRESGEGVLSGNRSTAEDTWMNSISHGQRNMVVPGTTTNVMKAAGTTLGYTTKKTHDGVSAHPDPRIGAPAVQHAVNNEATIRAAKHLGDRYGVDGNVPAVLAQEVPWTNARRAGSKDPDFKKATTRPKAAKETSPLKGRVTTAEWERQPDGTNRPVSTRSQQFSQLEMRFPD